MLCSTSLVLSIHLGSLNEGRHIYKIVEPVIFTGVVFLASASSGNFPDIVISNDVKILKTRGKL